MSDPNEFLKAINILTEQYKEDKNYKDDLYNEVERLLKENKEKDQIIEQQRKEIEALKQQKNRYIEIEDKDRIIIYDTKKDKFTWRTRWSELPSNIIDDLYKNELMNYYKTNILKVVRDGVFYKNEKKWSCDFYYSGYYRDGRDSKIINTEFSIPLLKQIQNVRGELRNIANRNEVKDWKCKNYLSDGYSEWRCIGICKNGERCKCRGHHDIEGDFNIFNKRKSLMNYLYNYKNIESLSVCSRHLNQINKDINKLDYYVIQMLNKVYDNYALPGTYNSKYFNKLFGDNIIGYDYNLQ